MQKIFYTFLTLSMILAACAPANTPPGDLPVSSETPASGEAPAYAPQPGDERLLRGEVYLDSHDLLILESFPPQYVLTLAGSLPTPCHQLRAVILTNQAAGRVDVELYSLVDPDVMCIQVLEPFELNLPLGSFETGTYQVYINNENVAEITAP